MLTSRNTWFCGSLVICFADLLLRYSLFLQCRIHLHEHAVHVSTPAALLPSWKHHWCCLFAAQLLFKLFHISAVAPQFPAFPNCTPLNLCSQQVGVHTESHPGSLPSHKSSLSRSAQPVLWMKSSLWSWSQSSHSDRCARQQRKH